jgi:hypothetical protein
MFTQKFAKYACERDSIKCVIGKYTAVARIYRDDLYDSPDERNDGFWPSHCRDVAGYVPPERFKEAMAKAQSVMRAWELGEWWYCGVCVTIERAGVQLTGQYDHAIWGVECNFPDSDNSWLTEIANDLLPDAIKAAEAKIAALLE